MLQVTRVNLEELFSVKYGILKEITFDQLAQIFEAKLNLNQEDGIKFARFTTQEPADDVAVPQDLSKPIELINIITNIMSHRFYPVMYGQPNEDQAKLNFTKAFLKSKQEFFKEINEAGKKLQLINLDTFKEIVRKFVPTSEILTDEMDIECAFIMMSRGVPFEDLSKLSEEDLLMSLEGFQANKIEMIFKEDKIQKPKVLSTKLLTEDLDIKKRPNVTSSKEGSTENARRQRSTEAPLSATTITSPIDKKI